MPEIGYTLSSEEHHPNDLVEHASRAEAVGFDFLSVSDHFHPWNTAQGESPFVWSTLGGVAAATDDVDVGVGVSAPIVRMHPAIYAQAAATAAAEFGDGFWAVGPQDTVQTWEDNGGDGPRFCQLKACVADSEDAAVSTAHELWPNSALPGELGTVLPTPAHFEQATQLVSEEDIAEGSIMTGPDAQEHIDSLQAALDTGYDHVYVMQIGDDQAALFDLYREDVLPSF